MDACMHSMRRAAQPPLLALLLLWLLTLLLLLLLLSRTGPGCGRQHFHPCIWGILRSGSQPDGLTAAAGGWQLTPPTQGLLPV